MPVIVVAEVVASLTRRERAPVPLIVAATGSVTVAAHGPVGRSAAVVHDERLATVHHVVADHHGSVHVLAVVAHMKNATGSAPAHAVIGDHLLEVPEDEGMQRRVVAHSQDLAAV